MRFVEGRRYFSGDGRELYVCSRTKKGLLRAEVGLGLPANYKLRTDFRGNEYVTAKGHTFVADH